MRLFRKTLQTTSWSSALAKYAAFVLFFLMWKGYAQGQDEEEAKKAALASITKIENYPSVVFKGRFEKGKFSSEVAFSVRGVQVWNEHTSMQMDDPNPEKTAADLIKIR